MELKGVRVCDRWLYFGNFLQDIRYIDGFDSYLFYNCQLHLDKDLKQFYLPHNQRVYSKETCSFLPPDINVLLANQTNNIQIDEFYNVYYNGEIVYSLPINNRNWIRPAVIVNNKYYSEEKNMIIPAEIIKI